MKIFLGIMAFVNLAVFCLNVYCLDYFWAGVALLALLFSIVGICLIAKRII